MKGAMVSVATGAMNSVLDKLATLLGKEFSWLHSGVKRDIVFLKDELSCMNALLEKMADTELIDPQMKEWRNQVREMAYDIEDCIDSYMLQQGHSGIMGFFREYVQKVMELVSHHGVAQQIRELKDRIAEASYRRKRYKIDTEVKTGTTSIDPRLPALYAESSDLVGIDIPRGNLINFLDDGELSLKVISIVGFGGLGKTTLAKEAYKKICGKFDCHAFVSVSQKPEVKKILWTILSQVMNPNYANNSPGDEQWLIDVLRGLLRDRRYFIIIDDIWDTEVWKIMKCALLENTHGSRIIVTTRIASVAKSCCSHHHDTVYELTPLREADAKLLFFQRTVGSEDSCPDKLRDVANEIIKRCGGMPLAIITMASLLTTKSNSREEWVSVHNSMGLGLKNHDMEGMQRILSLSYKDLPYHLKTCLLYLSMYPEDYEIDMHKLVRRWIAEGFIDIKSGRSSEEEGECFFNELINRSLIQPAGIGLDGQITSCRVHDMILDLIISKAVEENFISFAGDHTYTFVSSAKVRRLSIDYRGNQNIILDSSMISSHLRSLCVFGYSQNMLPISNFQALRMLDLESGVKLQNCDLQRIGDLSQLRYLRIAASRITHLPGQIGELQFLETLDLGRTWIRKLPESIVKLQHLKFLSVSGSQLLDGIGKMQSLEVLSGVSVYDACSIDSLRELGSLANLKTLWLTWHISGARYDSTMYADAFASSLGKLVSSSLRHLCIVRGHGSVDIPLDSWSAPPHLLRQLNILGGYFRRIPEWMASMVNLYKLSIRFKQMTQDILHTLGNLHSLLDLELKSETADGAMELLIIHNSGFQSLKIFRLYGPIMGLIFEAGATPQLEQLSMEIRAVQAPLADNADLGIHHLTSLRDLNIWINCEGARMEDVELLEANMTNAINLLPNKPRSHFYRENQDDMVTDVPRAQEE